MSDLRERLTFAKRVTQSDAYGNERADWQNQFTVSARVKPMRGSEEVLASRLAGIQPVTIRIRYSTQAKAITPDWRATDARSGVVYSLKAVMNPDERKAYLEITATAGEAA